MQLGKSLLGALIGAALGIGLLVLINSLTAWDKYWLAIPVALLTGLGVRWVANTCGHPSYVRGVLTGVISILAFMAGQYVVAEVATRRSQAKPIVAQESDVRPADRGDTDEQADTPADAETPSDGTDPADEEPADSEAPADATEPIDTVTPADGEAPADSATPPDNEEPAELAAPQRPATEDQEEPAGVPAVARPQRGQEWTTPDLIWLCAAALVGYGLGRGSDAPAVRPRDDDAPVAPNRAMPPSD
jgi:hypothetical protein